MVILWVMGPLTSQKTASLTWCLDTNSRLSFEHSTDVLSLLSSQKLHHLLDSWMLTQMLIILWGLKWGSDPFTLTKTSSLTWRLDANSGLFSLGIQLSFWSFYCCLVIPPFQDTLLLSYLIEYFHQAVKFPVHFFRELCRLLLYMFLEIVINLSFQLLSLVILFVSSVRSTSL